MAAVMLAGAPLCNEAFAAASPSATTIAATTKLTSGMKLILKTTSGYAQTTAIAKTNYVSLNDAAVTIDKAEVLEIRNFSNKTFQLWTSTGKQVAYKDAAGKIYTTFYAGTATSSVDVANFTGIYTYEVGMAGNLALAVNAIETTTLTYTADELNEFNANSTTFSFLGENLEGNVFNSVVPFTFAANDLAATSAAGTYFVKGAAADIKALKDAVDATARQAALKKLSVVAVLNDVYGINTGVAGEGYKLALISGADFYKTTGAAEFDNAAFTSIVEADQLNNEGEVVLSITPKVGETPASVPVTINSVKASASDTKTYVTTVAATTTSKFATVSNPTLGANTYFAASEFLKAGEVSAFNIYATSNTPSTSTSSTEYHKYYVNTSNGSAFVSSFQAQQDVDLTNPSAQWIATGFDGKYTLTLQNRLNPSETLSLRLAATANAGEYAVSGSALAGMTIKLLPAALTKYDGSLELSEEQIKEGVTLSFSGKNASVGELIFYVSEDAAGNLVPTLDASKAAKLNVTRAVDAKKQDLAMNITPYAYLDAAGNVVAADVAKADTLVVPAYQFSYGTQNVANTFALGTSADYYLINKTLDGGYTVTYSTTAPTYSTTYAIAGNNAVGVQAITTGSVVGNFALTTKYFAPAEDGFASLAVDANDNYDYASLPAVSRHATFENALGAVSFQENKNGILEGIMSAEPATFWLDTADSETNVPTFYISKGIKAAEETKAYSDEVRNFLVYAPDSMSYFDEASATIKTNAAYVLEGTTNTLKAIFHPAALVAEDTMTTVVDGKEVSVVAKKTKAGQIAALKNFQFGIRLADENVADEYVIYSKKDASYYLYALNGKLGFTNDAKKALVVTLGEGDATANEAIAAENVAVIAGEGVVTVKGAAGKQVVVSNILGQVIANKVATSDEETIAVAAGVAVVVVDGEATKVVVK